MFGLWHSPHPLQCFGRARPNLARSTPLGQTTQGAGQNTRRTRIKPAPAATKGPRRMCSSSRAVACRSYTFRPGLQTRTLASRTILPPLLRNCRHNLGSSSVRSSSRHPSGSEAHGQHTVSTRSARHPSGSEAHTSPSSAMVHMHTNLQLKSPSTGSTHLCLCGPAGNRAQQRRLCLRGIGGGRGI